MQMIEGLSLATRQYLTFLLDGQGYGIDVLAVQELRCREATTPFPNAPEFVDGIINLRGMMIPVIDLRTYFSLPHISDASTSAVIIINLHDQNIVIGMIVDAISDVHGIRNEQIRPASDLSGAISHDFATELTTVSHEIVVLLDIHKLIHEGFLSSQTEAGCEQERKLIYAATETCAAVA